MDEETRRVWLSDSEQIASFHEMDGWRTEVLAGREALLTLAQALTEQGWRFQ